MSIKRTIEINESGSKYQRQGTLSDRSVVNTSEHATGIHKNTVYVNQRADITPGLVVNEKGERFLVIPVATSGTTKTGTIRLRARGITRRRDQDKISVKMGIPGGNITVYIPDEPLAYISQD